ncbi:MAG: amidohydrolase family protein [Akkermansiaceae bacterium]
MRKLDTHQHLLYPELFAYSWVNDFPTLQRSFTLENYVEAARCCEIEATLFMEVDVDADQHVEESFFFTQCSIEATNKISGIVAKCRPEVSSFSKEIDLMQNSALKGVRRVLHTQPDELSQSRIFRQNISTLEEYDLSFDLCVNQSQLNVACDLVSSCSDVRFILDHCGAPNIAEHNSQDCESWQQWLLGMQLIAKEPNVTCKLSGISTYGTNKQRDARSLRPYLTEILEAFGPERIVWGSDWPVCNLANGLFSWSKVTDELLGELSVDEQNAIAYHNAKRIYKV